MIFPSCTTLFLSGLHSSCVETAANPTPEPSDRRSAAVQRQKHENVAFRGPLWAYRSITSRKWASRGKPDGPNACGPIDASSEACRLDVTDMMSGITCVRPKTAHASEGETTTPKYEPPEAGGAPGALLSQLALRDIASCSSRDNA